MRLALPSSRGRRIRITLTSLVDVVFILLFFFMLASRQLGWRALDVDLSAPAASAPSLPPVLRVTLAADGDLVLEGEAVDLPTLRARVAAQAARGPVEITPGPGVQVDALVRLLDALEPGGARLLLGAGR